MANVSRFDPPAHEGDRRDHITCLDQLAAYGKFLRALKGPEYWQARAIGHGIRKIFEEEMGVRDV